MNFYLPEEEETRPLGGAPAAAKLARMVRRGGVRFAFVTNGGRTDFAEAHDEGMPIGFLTYAQAIENAGFVMGSFGVPSETQVTFGDLLGQEDKLRLLAAIVRPGAETGPTTVTVTSSVDLPSVESEKAAVIVVTWVTFGDRVLLVIPAVIGKPQWEKGVDGAVQMTLPGPPQVRLARVVSVADAKSLDVTPLLDRIMQDLKAEGVQLVIGPPRPSPKAP